MNKPPAALAALACAFTLLVTAPAPSASAASEPGPAYSVPRAKLAAALDCPKTFARSGRAPVLLVHGTSVTAEENWGWTYARALPAAGFDVCTVSLPDYAFVDVQMTSEYVVHAIRTMARTAKRKISVVGLSQGVLQPRWAIKWWPDIRTLLDDYVGMAGTNHGSVFGNAACVSECLPALWQQYARSEGYRAAPRFLTALNAGDETPGRLSYTSVYSLTDPIIQPVPTAALDGASNIAVQDICPGRVVEHVQSAWDAAYYAVVLDALTHRGPADPTRIDPEVCAQVAMPGVDALDAMARTAVLYGVISQRQASHPKVAQEPPTAAYVVVGADTGRSSWHTMTTDAGARRYLLHEPPNRSGRRPLVVYLHGCSERADATAVASGYSRLASERGFYVVYPEQPSSANGNHCWNWFQSEHQHRDAGEPSILAAITRHVMRHRSIDPRRVYVTGISAGGFMAVVMAVTHPDLFAAVGSEAGGQYRGLPCLTVPCVIPPEQSARWAYEEMGARARQIPLFALVGDVDGVSPAENTERLVAQMLTQDDLADDGEDNGSVSREPASRTTGAVQGGYAYSIDRYRNRAGCLLVERWMVEGMGHVHSGGDAHQNWSDPLGPDAAEASWRFFAAHPRRGGRQAAC